MDHSFAVTVYYEDTDMGGIVYHANYLKYIERARSDWVRGLGLDQLALREAGTVFAVRRIESDFLAPARLDERLDVRTGILRSSGARLLLAQENPARREGAVPRPRGARRPRQRHRRRAAPAAAAPRPGARLTRSPIRARPVALSLNPG